LKISGFKAWGQFLSDPQTAADDAALSQRTRRMDEYEYAFTFGLNWPNKSVLAV
jgi:hypothetical protein